MARREAFWDGTLPTIIAATASVAIAAFGISTLLLRARLFPPAIPLSAILIALCLACGGPLVRAIWPDVLAAFYEFSLPAYLAIPIALWFFLRATAKPDAPGLQMAEKAWIASLALLFCLVMLDVSVPDPSGRSSMAISSYLIIVPALWIAALAAWLFCTVRFARASRHLIASYTQNLHMQFSNTQGRDLGEAKKLLLPLTALWAGLLILAIGRNVGGFVQVPELAVSLAFLLLIWTMTLWSISLRGGPVREQADSERYTRSALDGDRARRIAERLDQAMRKDELFRDANLSLDQLARHVGTSPNHVSQTLNGVIGCSFFDYVNRFRIEASFALLRARDRPVIDIAYETGFNAKSSFYRAFAKETGTTPTAWANNDVRSAEGD